MKLEEIREELKAYRIRFVAKKIGYSHVAVYDFIKGIQKEPKKELVDRLIAFLRRD